MQAVEIDKDLILNCTGDSDLLKDTPIKLQIDDYLESMPSSHLENEDQLTSGQGTEIGNEGESDGVG